MYNKAMTEGDKSDGYLPDGEDVINKLRIGNYEVVTSKQRISFVRKFPPAFVEVPYSDISNLQHVTAIRWDELGKAVGLAALSGILFFYDMGKPFIQPTTDLINTINTGLGDALPVELLLKVVMAGSAIVGAYTFVKFLPSLRGYFKISRKNGIPVIISTGMSPELRNLIREIENQMEKGVQQTYARQYQPEPQKVEEKLDIRSIIASKISDFENQRVIMITAKSENHIPVISNMAQKLVNEKKMGGVYLSITKPSDGISSILSAANVSTDDVYFIDCISLMAGKAQGGPPNEKVTYIENPSSLEEISMYLDRMLAKVKSEKKFLFMDSLSSLLIYNTDKSVKEFTHYLINKIRLEKLVGVILTIEKKEVEDLVRTLTPMCDIELKF